MANGDALDGVSIDQLARWLAVMIPYEQPHAESELPLLCNAHLLETCTYQALCHAAACIPSRAPTQPNELTSPTAYKGKSRAREIPKQVP